MQYFKEVAGYSDSWRVVVISLLAVIVLFAGFVDAYALPDHHATPAASHSDGDHGH